MNIFQNFCCFVIRLITPEGINLQVEKPAKPLKFDVDEKLDFGGRFGHRNPVMPDDRLENDVLNARRDDFGKVRKYPHAVGNNVRADDINGQMEKPMQIAEPHVQQEEDQVWFLCVLLCFMLQEFLYCLFIKPYLHTVFNVSLILRYICVHI